MLSLRSKLAEDVRYMYLLAFLLIILGTLVSIAPSGLISPFAQRAYDYIETIKPGERVLYWAFFRGVIFPEQWACTLAIMEHVIAKGARFVFLATNEESIVILGKLMNVYFGPKWEDSLDYGERFVYLGYMPVTAAGISTTATNFKSLFPYDYKGTSLNDLPVTKDVKGATDFRLVICNGGAPARNFYTFWTLPSGGISPRAIVNEDVGALMYNMDYWVPNFLELVVGAKLGSEYETLRGYVGISQRFMNSVFLVTAFIFVGMVLNNFFYIQRKRKAGGSD